MSKISLFLTYRITHIREREKTAMLKNCSLGDNAGSGTEILKTNGVINMLTVSRTGVNKFAPVMKALFEIFVI